jgi:hypothetical protein
MTQTFNILQFVAHLESVRNDMTRLGPSLVRHGAIAIQAEARSYFGNYTARPKWPQLAESTKKDREHKGYAPNEPLLREGTLRDSIGIKISHDGLEAQIGTDDERGPWFELGTSRMPARPFLTPAAIKMAPKIQKAAGRAAVSVLLGRGLMSAEMRDLMELLHLTKEAAEYAKEQVVNPYLPGDDDQKRHRQ